jgi:hypothetical protein
MMSVNAIAVYAVWLIIPLTVYTWSRVSALSNQQRDLCMRLTEVTRPELFCDSHLVDLANAEAEALCNVATAVFVWQSIGSKAVLFGIGAEWLGPSKL